MLNNAQVEVDKPASEISALQHENETEQRKRAKQLPDMDAMTCLYVYPCRTVSAYECVRKSMLERSPCSAWQRESSTDWCRDGDGGGGEHIPANSVTVRSVCQPVKPVTEAEAEQVRPGRQRRRDLKACRY